MPGHISLASRRCPAQCGDIELPHNHFKGPPERLAYGVLEAARVVGCGRSMIYVLLASGQLKAVRLRGRTLIPADELRRFLDALPPARPVNDAA
jgi:excisionase family DNA binding protein